MEFLKKNWKMIILVIWLILSTLYIAVDIWNQFKANVIQNAYIAGQTDTVKTIIDQATKECKPVNVYVGDKKVDLINVACLQQSTLQSQSGAREIGPGPSIPKQ